MPDPIQLVDVSASIIDPPSVVMTSAAGSYTTDLVNGVIRITMGPPVQTQNGGPDKNHTYVIKGSEGLNPVKLVGVSYTGLVDGVETYEYNMGGNAR